MNVSYWLKFRRAKFMSDVYQACIVYKVCTILVQHGHGARFGVSLLYRLCHNPCLWSLLQLQWQSQLLWLDKKSVISSCRFCHHMQVGGYICIKLIWRLLKDVDNMVKNLHVSSFGHIIVVDLVMLTLLLIGHGEWLKQSQSSTWTCCNCVFIYIH